MRHLLRAAGLALGLFAAASPAVSQSFPNGPVTLVVPYAAGGPSDVIGRLLGQSMARTLGQPVIIENVAGAGGTVGAARVARAAPDGQTLLLHHLALAAGASLYPNLPYDTATAFAPIGLVNFGPFAVLGRKSLPANSIGDALALIRKEGDKMRLAHAGTGSGSHLCNMILQSALKTKVTEIAYRGTGPAMNDLVAGHVDMLCDQTTTAVPQIKGGTVQAYAVTSLTRNPQLPNLPTLDEAGIKGFEISLWNALYAPKGTPKPVIDALNKALEVALAEPGILAKFTELGTVLFPADARGPAATGAKLASEIKKWNEVIKAAGVKTN